MRQWAARRARVDAEHAVVARRERRSPRRGPGSAPSRRSSTCSLVEWRSQTPPAASPVAKDLLRWLGAMLSTAAPWGSRAWASTRVRPSVVPASSRSTRNQTPTEPSLAPATRDCSPIRKATLVSSALPGTRSRVSARIGRAGFAHVEAVERAAPLDQVDLVGELRSAARPPPARAPARPAARRGTRSVVSCRVSRFMRDSLRCEHHGAGVVDGHVGARRPLDGAAHPEVEGHDRARARRRQAPRGASSTTGATRRTLAAGQLRVDRAAVGGVAAGKRREARRQRVAGQDLGQDRDAAEAHRSVGEAEDRRGRPRGCARTP